MHWSNDKSMWFREFAVFNVNKNMASKLISFNYYIYFSDVV